MECKSAYQVLVDERQRRQYDRTLNVIRPSLSNLAA